MSIGRTWARLSPGMKTLVGSVVLGVGAAIGGTIWAIAQHEIDTRDPVAYVVRVDNTRYGETAAATVTSRAISPGAIPSTEGTCQAIHAWAVGDGAVDTFTYLKLTLQGQADAAVSVDDIQVHVVTRDPPIRDGTMVECMTGGSNEVISLHYDLGHGELIEAFGSDKDGEYSATPYFQDHSVTLAKNESVSFQIDASGCTCHCKWELMIDLTVDGQAREVTVRQPNGDPFETTATVRPARWLVWMGSDPPVLQRESLNNFYGPCEEAAA